VIASIDLGPSAGNGLGPQSVAVDDTTGRVFVLNSTTARIGVVDGASMEVEKTIEVEPRSGFSLIFGNLWTDEVHRRLYLLGAGVLDIFDLDTLQPIAQRTLSVSLGSGGYAGGSLHFMDEASGTLYGVMYLSGGLEDFALVSADLAALERGEKGAVRPIVELKGCSPAWMALDLEARRAFFLQAGSRYCAEGHFIAVDLDTKTVLHRDSNDQGYSSMWLDAASHRLYRHGYGGEVDVMDARTLEQVDEYPLATDGYPIAFDPESQRSLALVSGYDEVKLQILSADLESVLKEITVPGPSYAFRYFAVDWGREVVYFSFELGHRLLRVPLDGAPVTSLRLGADPYNVAVDSDRQRVYVTENSAAPRLFVIDAESSTILYIYDLPPGTEYPPAHVVDPTTGWVYGATWNYAPPEAGPKDAALIGSLGLGALAWDISLDRLYGYSMRDNALLMIDATTGEELTRIRLGGGGGGRALGVKVDPGLHRVYAACGFNGLEAYDGRTLEYLGAAPMERGEVTRLAVDPQTHVVYVEQTVYLDEGPVAKLLAVDGVTLETLQAADLPRHAQDMAINPQTGHLFLAFPSVAPLSSPQSIVEIREPEGLGAIASFALEGDMARLVLDSSLGRAYVTLRRAGRVVVIQDVAGPFPTLTTTPSPTPTPIPPAAECERGPDYAFLAAWEEVADEVGCATAGAAATSFAEQAFEHGRMFWTQEGDRVYVLFEDEGWAVYPNKWFVGQPEEDPTIVPPEGKLQPRLGFGATWRDELGVRDRLGWALQEERSYIGKVQHFQHGVMLQADGDRIYGLLEGGTWQVS
jgi:DNA-binding beta-propeller fold protein YncE